jgi:hypothetical protein
MRKGFLPSRFARAAGAAVVALVLALSINCTYGAVNQRALLAHRLPAAKLDNIPFSDAIDFLRDIAGVNIHVDWKTLQAANITKDTLINLNLHDVSAQKILNLILTEAGPGDVLTYFIDQNVIEITTRAQADSQMITVVYYVQDLLQPNPSFNYTISNINSGSAQVTGGGGGGGGQSLTTGQNGQQTQTAEQVGQNLIKLIETVVRPEIWRDNGGQATMDIWNGNLIVTAPRSVQELIGGPVDQ